LRGAPLTVLMACRKGILVGRNVLSCLLPRFGDVRAVFCFATLSVLKTVWVVTGVAVWKEFVASVVRVFRRNRTTERWYQCTGVPVYRTHVVSSPTKPEALLIFQLSLLVIWAVHLDANSARGISLRTRA
jgi:hypothetical protein